MNTTTHRLDGLEPENLLAFLALLGLLRALEAADRGRDDHKRFRPRAAWDIDRPPLRPTVVVSNGAGRHELAEAAALGIDLLAAVHEFDGAKNLTFVREESAAILEAAAREATADNHDRADLLASLMSDGAFKIDKTETIIPTPLCLMFGQGHQFFLDRLANVPKQAAPPPRREGRKRVTISPTDALLEALFEPWHRTDPTFSFRWDPEEDVRYALMAGDPTDAAYKTGTQHAANRLAAVGLPALTVAPVKRVGRPAVAILGGEYRRGFSFAWPVWHDPASLMMIRALLGHPDLRTPGALKHLSVEHVLVARRISVGKYMNFSPARFLDQTIP
jgi:hypothetical protein